MLCILGQTHPRWRFREVAAAEVGAALAKLSCRRCAIANADTADCQLLLAKQHEHRAAVRAGRSAVANARGMDEMDRAARRSELLTTAAAVRMCTSVTSLTELNHAGHNALHRAAVGDFEQGALFRLAAGSSGCSLTCAPTRMFGATPLHLASGGGRIDAVDELLDAGASVLAPDAEGMLPLHAAIHQLVTVLVTYGPSTTHAAIAASPFVSIVSALACAHAATAHGRRLRVCTATDCVARLAASGHSAVPSMLLDRTRSIIDDVMSTTALRVPRGVALKVVKHSLVWALLLGVHDEAFDRRRHALLTRLP